MATAPKFRLKQVPTDIWSVREKLCLASSVLRSGDQNWVSVSRAIKPYGEANRPPDWFSQKNCAIQYSDLLEKVETPKRKRGDRADVETPGNLIVRKLTIERIEELKRLINEEQQKHRKLRQEVDSVRSGSVDERLDEVWNRIQEEIKLKAIAETTHHKWLQEREARIAAIKNAPKTLGKAKRLYPKQPRIDEMRRNSSQSEQSEQESALDSPLSEPLSIEYFVQVEDVSSPQPSASHPDGVSSTTKSTFPNIPVATPVPSHGSQTSSTSPLLTSLLKSPAPTTAISPTAGSMLTSPTPQPKEGTLPTTQASPRASTTPQPFFDPSCALATAAARQLAVATAPSPTPSSVESMFVRDRSQPINQISSIEGHIHSLQAQSATSSAPTLSKLLELPPGVPGKLPPLPIIQPEQTVSSTLQSSTASTVTITTATPSSALVGTNVVSVVTPETTVVNPSDVFPPAGSSVSTLPSESTEHLLNKAFISHQNVEIKLEPSSPIADVNEEETEVEIKPEVTVKVEETDTVEESFQEEDFVDKSEICKKEEKDQEEEAPLTKIELPEETTEEELKESCADILSEGERTEAEAAAEQQEVTTETETEGSPPETDSETMAESNIEELVLSKEDITEGTDEDGKENIRNEPHQLPSAIEEQSEESRNEGTVSDEQVSENQVVTEDENPPTVEEKKGIWEKPEIIEKEDLPTSPESVKPQEEEIKITRKTSKRGRKPKAKPGKPLNAEESDESTRDKKDDDNSNASSLLDKEVNVKQSDTNSKLDRVKETPPATPKSELLQQHSECSEHSLIETRRKPTLSVSESIPNSPASTSQSDDQDNAKDYRTWKKAIMLVWNAAANHKFANTFLHPVTDDVAPGYHSIVYRPMDLSAIKKNIETGAIKSTLEFQRDMMLMFQNAVMYNSSDHNVFHMAVEMQKEVMEHIQDFLATQLMVQTADTKVLRGREREREKKSEGDKEDVKRKHSFAPEAELKPKKRRVRE